MANPIADLYNAGAFIDVPLSTLVKTYVLALKDGHNRAYQSILTLEDNATILTGRVQSLEDAQGDIITADQAEIIGYNVAQANHGLADFDVVAYNGSSYIKAGSGVSAIGIAKVVDVNNFIFIKNGLFLMPPTLTDDLGDPFDQGHFYFLSSTVSGKMQKAKPTVGIYQSILQVVIYDSVKYAIVKISDPVKLILPVKTSITEGVGFEVNGSYEWTVPNNVFRIKATLSGGGGGGGGEGGQTSGTDSTLSLNGGLILTASGGEVGKWDNADANAPVHANATGGDINIIGGGSVGGIGGMNETGGDNENIASNGSNAGLCIKYMNVIPQDTINIIIGEGGTGGVTGDGTSNHSSNGTDGYCFIEY